MDWINTVHLCHAMALYKGLGMGAAKEEMSVFHHTFWLSFLLYYVHFYICYICY